MAPKTTTLMCQKRLMAKGIVQGVGFRPFVYRLADELKLAGTVLNDNQGVEIVLQGESAKIDLFIARLQSSPPPLARIDELVFVEEPISTTFDHFNILQSETSDSQAIVAVSADKSTCTDCLTEMQDKHNRHYLYPFTNCTNCGPRYTIIKHLPYDRHFTSMADFDMCEQCAKAYHDPFDRRYHAQPVSCNHCGPQLSLYVDNVQVNCQSTEVITQTVALLNQGKIVALKGLGGFHLVCDATNDAAVITLRKRKHRPAKPLAVMAANLEQAKHLAVGTDVEWQVVDSAEKPITLLTKMTRSLEALVNPDLLDRQPSKDARPVLAKSVAPRIDRIGIFLPYTPLHHLLLQQFNKPIVATSANRSGEPIICSLDGIISKLGHVVDAIVDHNRPIANACDDSVVQVINDQLQVIRLARGYAPLTLAHGLEPSNFEPTLAVGAQQKNTIALAFNRNMILSPHIGDLFSLEAEQYFEDNLTTFKRLYHFNPKCIITDNHPEYAPSQWANRFIAQHYGVTPLSIQHHYAHILAVMAANQYRDKVIGFSFDGTGLGDKGILWGSEMMLADVNTFTTLAHFSEFKLIGGEQAIKQPVRILLALLFDSYTVTQISQMPIPAIKRLSLIELNNLHRLWLNNSHCIPCRAVGRLFDALAVALGLIELNQFEGQAGMLIEAQAAKTVPLTAATVIEARDSSVIGSANVDAEQVSLLSIKALPQADIIIWQSQEWFKDIIEIICHTKDPAKVYIPKICNQFIRAIADSIKHIAQEYPQYPMVLSGGVFQNKHLLSHCLTDAETDNHLVLSPKLVPINDGGIALGQLWYALHCYQNKSEIKQGE
jgi:hydrogenase maturation protein HypF